MNYQDFLARWQTIGKITQQIVAATEQELSRCGDPLLMKQNTALPFTELEWQAFALNTAKLVGVKRLRGGPYASHPTRMAFFMAELLRDDDAHRTDSVIYCLFHDYLEEGDGRNRPALMAFGEAFGTRIDAVRAAVLLSEPQIDCQDIMAASTKPIKPKHLEVISYIVQIEQALATNKARALANTCIMDKIDNLHDLSYILKNPKLSPTRLTARLCEKMAIVACVGRHLGGQCDPQLLDILNDSLADKTAALNLPAGQIDEVAATLDTLYSAYSAPLWDKIRGYQQKIGLHSL